MFLFDNETCFYLGNKYKTNNAYVPYASVTCEICIFHNHGRCLLKDISSDFYCEYTQYFKLCNDF